MNTCPPAKPMRQWWFLSAGWLYPDMGISWLWLCVWWAELKGQHPFWALRTCHTPHGLYQPWCCSFTATEKLLFWVTNLMGGEPAAIPTRCSQTRPRKKVLRAKGECKQNSQEMLTSMTMLSAQTLSLNLRECKITRTLHSTANVQKETSKGWG